MPEQTETIKIDYEYFYDEQTDQNVVIIGHLVAMRIPAKLFYKSAMEMARQRSDALNKKIVVTDQMPPAGEGN